MNEMIIKTYDFVILYELKNREFENVLLLKYELERRGYRVHIIETWEARFIKIPMPVKSEVVVTISLLEDSSVRQAFTYVKGCKKLVNLQWEQIYANGDAQRIKENRDYTYCIKESATKAVHISWGPNDYDRLVNIYNIDPKKVFMTGFMSLDFLRPELRSYYKTKEEIQNLYNLDKRKKVYLFISSFSFVDHPEKYIETDLFQGLGYDINEFVKISYASQKAILDWFEKVLVEYQNIDIIYRPHPAEYGNLRLGKMERKYSNFHVISELSVKQWILVADKIYTWWSTSVGEVYAAGKGCSILRPMNIPYDSEIEFYVDCKYITSFKQFEDSYLDNAEFPIRSDMMNKHYFVDPNEPSYIKIVNCMEEVYSNDYYNMNVEGIPYYPRWKLALTNTKHLVLRIIVYSSILSSMYVKIFSWRNVIRKKEIEKQFEQLRYNFRMAKVNKYNSKEAKAVTERIKRILN